MKLITILITIYFTLTAFTQQDSTERSEFPVETQELLDLIDSTLLARDYAELNWEPTYDTTAFLPDSVVITFSDSVYAQRIASLNENTPMDLRYNEATATLINYFNSKRGRAFIEKVLSRSGHYFEYFEGVLDAYEIPVELRYLSVIESGLNSSARSRAGACGLWQFMYATGKMYGLNINSYVDERNDPMKATVAAAKYLKRLYKLYGDWNLALAAYNAGPGNVNKAIRRSGGHKDYWKIRPYLPRETRQYVPKFIAVMYLMEYAKEHQFRYKDAEYKYYEVDTVCLKKGVYREFIDSLIGITPDDFKFLNPSFRTNYVPSDSLKQTCIRVPKDKLYTFLDFEDSLYALSHPKEGVIDIEPVDKRQYHYVRSGESLGLIAKRYGVSVRQIMDWNGLRSNKIYPKQKLVIYSSEKKPVQNSTPKATSKPKQTTVSDKVPSEYKWYTIQSGDNFWDISVKFGTTVAVIEKLNPGVKSGNLKPGQKIKVPK